MHLTVHILKNFKVFVKSLMVFFQVYLILTLLCRNIFIQTKENNSQ